MHDSTAAKSAKIIWDTLDVWNIEKHLFSGSQIHKEVISGSLCTCL